MSLQQALRFEPQAYQRVWGGERLQHRLRGEIAWPSQAGEAWMLCDRPEQASHVAEGPLSGRTLDGLMLSEEAALLGESARSASGGFPLIVKWLDTAALLSLQVHPGEGLAKRLGSEPKDECWYVCDAEPGSVLYLGLRDGVDAAAFADASANGAVLELLQSFTPRPGDFFHVPAGTLHSIGAGLTLVEIQQNSDTTYRAHDWDRVGLDGKCRQLHREEALQAIAFGRHAPGPIRARVDDEAAVNPMAVLLDEGPFGVQWLQVLEDYRDNTQGRACIYIVLAGSGALRVGENEACRMEAGDAWLLPADAANYMITESDGDLELLRVEARA
ncbi:MAG: mannose-6-phosphate isomerase [Planctomycetes bacterium]|nr:mannose-6-phosphate isomerase [Planctomycetota bacterium]